MVLGIHQNARRTQCTQIWKPNDLIKELFTMECSGYTKATSGSAVPQNWQQSSSPLGHYHTINVDIYTPKKWGLCEDGCLMWVWPSVQGHSQLVATHSQVAAWMNTWTSPSGSPFFPLAEIKRNQKARELLNTFTRAPSRVEKSGAWIYMKQRATTEHQEGDKAM